MADGPTLITSVQRALRLVEAVGASDRPVPAKALAPATGEHLSTTYHLLRTLVFEGYLRRIDGGYALGDRVVALARHAPGHTLHHGPARSTPSASRAWPPRCCGQATSARSRSQCPPRVPRLLDRSDAGGRTAHLMALGLEGWGSTRGHVQAYDHVKTLPEGRTV